MNRITGSQYQCPNCQAHFAGPRAYQMHFRDGACIPTEALTSAGLELTAWGFWAATLRLRSKRSAQGETA